MNERDDERQSETRFVEGVHFYFENGLMVLTAKFLSERGFCCGSGCRHCPYSDEERTAARLKKKLF